jgi:undecaprenyl diphosphate synthase
MNNFRDPSELENIPQHVAIIMDGNGRWATSRNWLRTKGHDQGVKTVRHITECASALGIKQLTLYSMSTENWESRPRLEIKFLMRLLKTFVKSERKTMMNNNIRLTTIGHPEEFPQDVVDTINDTKKMTAGNTGMNLCLALNYGSRQEIVEAAQHIAREVKEGILEPEDITESLFSKYLYQCDMLEPDLLLRTAGEMRISNYLLWQISYSEIYVSEKLWPDFSEEDFYTALQSYGKRERRYGGLSNLNKTS